MCHMTLTNEERKSVKQAKERGEPDDDGFAFLRSFFCKLIKQIK